MSENSLTERLRSAVGMALVFIAAILTGLAVFMIVGEFLWGQPHGPSPAFMGVMVLPFAAISGWVGWRLL
jgi:hypothetical protein